MNKLDDGIDEAEDNLGNTSKATYQQAAKPVKLHKTEMTSVDNFGNSMAAFLLTVGVWVGAMAFCMLYPIGSSREKNGWRAWGRDACVYLPVSIVWGLAIMPLMNLFLDINPANYAATLGVLALAAVTFVSLIYFFNIALGKPAMGLVLILLCLQLACCGGIFPTSMTSGFYQVLSPFMPFTYSVEALRSTIANGNSILVPCLVLGGIALAFNLLSILVLHRKCKKQSQEVDISAQLAAMGISVEVN